MGCIASTTMKIPKLGSKIDKGELVSIFKNAGIKDVEYQLFDANYTTVNYADFKKFADIACSNVNKYRLESQDCDDLGMIFLGRAREYYGRTLSDYGIGIGLLTGDLRFKKEDTMRAHAINWFIDENKKLFLYDVMWNEIYEFNKDSMTAWFWLA